jgi:hypothetical protein
VQGFWLPKRASPRMRVVPRRQHRPLRVRSAHPPSAAPRRRRHRHRRSQPRGTPTSVLTDGAIFTATPAAAGAPPCRSCSASSASTTSAPAAMNQTCKVERFPKPSNKHLRALPAAATVTDLQHRIDGFLAYYNNTRPHRALCHLHAPPAFHDRPNAFPAGYQIPHFWA